MPKIESVEDITRERADRINRAAEHDRLVEDVRSATLLLDKLEKAEKASAPQGAALEHIIKLARQLPPDLVWEGVAYGGRCTDGLVAVAGSAMARLNNHAIRRTRDREAAAAKLARAKKDLAERFNE